MTKQRDSIKIMNAALDELPGGAIVIRGVVDPDSLDQLKVGEYQREVLPQAKIQALIRALEAGDRMPDIELGMRGGGYREHSSERVFYLQDATYIIDGLQRVTAGRALLQSGSGMLPHLGVLVHTETTEAWERDRFRILNANRTKLSPNVLLRNRRHDSQAVDCLYHLTHDKSFVMSGRISWNQRKQREHLIDAMVLLKIVGALHSHLGPGLSQTVDLLSGGLDKTMETVGRTTLRDNIKAYFDIVDQAWGLRTIVFTDTQPHLRLNFLRTLAKVFSDHTLFWKESRLAVDRDIVAKLRQFPIHDPSVSNLAGSSSSAAMLLYQHMVNHINSGKRTRRLVPRESALPPPDLTLAEETVEA